MAAQHPQTAVLPVLLRRRGKRMVLAAGGFVCYPRPFGFVPVVFGGRWRQYFLNFVLDFQRITGASPLRKVYAALPGMQC